MVHHAARVWVTLSVDRFDAETDPHADTVTRAGTVTVTCASAAIH